MQRRGGAAPAAVVARRDGVAQGLAGVLGADRVVRVVVAGGPAARRVEVAALPRAGERDLRGARPGAGVAGDLVADGVPAADAGRRGVLRRDRRLERERQRRVLVAHRERRVVDAVQAGRRVQVHGSYSPAPTSRNVVVPSSAPSSASQRSSYPSLWPGRRTSQHDPASGWPASVVTTRSRGVGLLARARDRPVAHGDGEVGGRRVPGGRVRLADREVAGKQVLEGDDAIRGAVVEVAPLAEIVLALGSIAAAGDRAAVRTLLLDAQRRGPGGRGDRQQDEQ